ncbi:MAG: 16S rRNA (guanine(966)-N(2))-methyltransferase RsmD [Candidatus Omnitrophota bacterium]|jgi:16S rRNA (guanine966-N2)-methyltransferase
MRIISGKYKGKAIFMPKGIRPTQNKVRKAVFDILGDIEGISFLELFAGTGAVGFEAKSRGVKELVLVENNRECIQAIKKSLAALKLFDCSLLTLEAEKCLEILKKHQKSFDVIFLDPPYCKDMVKKILQTIGACDILANNGLLVVQHYKKDDLPDTQGGLILCKHSHYGDTELTFYRRKNL